MAIFCYFVMLIILIEVASDESHMLMEYGSLKLRLYVELKMKTKFILERQTFQVSQNLDWKV